MKRYSRTRTYGIIVDKQKGENNLFELIRIGDMLEVKGTEYDGYIKVNDENDLRFIQEAANGKYGGVENVLAIWFRSSETMTRYELSEEMK